MKLNHRKVNLFNTLTICRTILLSSLRPIKIKHPQQIHAQAKRKAYHLSKKPANTITKYIFFSVFIPEKCRRFSLSANGLKFFFRLFPTTYRYIDYAYQQWDSAPFFFFFLILFLRQTKAWMLTGWCIDTIINTCIFQTELDFILESRRPEVTRQNPTIDTVHKGI